MALATPNAILKKRGSKKSRDEIEVVAGEVFPTYELGPEAQRAWDRLVRVMDDLGILSPSWSETMTIAAGAIGDIEIAAKDLNERGHISITERGETKNPSFTIKTSAQQTAHRYLSALGLTPTTIKNLVKPDKKGSNPFMDL
jgi:P27 family predicted phage terminase small subunit